MHVTVVHMHRDMTASCVNVHLDYHFPYPDPTSWQRWTSNKLTVMKLEEWLHWNTLNFWFSMGTLDNKNFVLKLIWYITQVLFSSQGELSGFRRGLNTLSVIDAMEQYHHMIRQCAWTPRNVFLVVGFTGHDRCCVILLWKKYRKWHLVDYFRELINYSERISTTYTMAISTFMFMDYCKKGWWFDTYYDYAKNVL